ncbi:MarR family winged helix-turn-helix transcriptional regulator [Camelimonas abortus]|uniref:MarR family winged helix-turn-helix transcriptional regulator n=1 Tax=Camelimonas abortus TaxID=1017184 RepID=A0ABV7LFE6_9HYPH
MHKSVGWALTVAARLHRAELGERLAGLGLFPGQEQLLQALYDHETMTMSALATLMRVRPPTVSKAVARLAAQGLVARIDGDAGDGRLVRVRLTAAGRARAAEIARIWGETEQRLLEGFDSRERKKLRKLLRRVAANFSGAPAPAGREAENAG